MGGVTGKVSTSDVVNAIRANVEDFVYPHQNTEIGKLSDRTTNLEIKTENMSNELDKVIKGIGDTPVLSDKITKIETQNSEFVTSISKLNKSVSEIETKTQTFEEKIAELEAKVAALEGFVQSLQADGYLTLANIKKAAAAACPICTHTHEEGEEEQPTE